MSKNKRALIAKQTVNIFNNMEYSVSIGDSVQAVSLKEYKSNSEVIRENDKLMTAINVSKNAEGKIIVIDKPVVDAVVNGIYKYGVLNFASAYNPGGGFLNGTMAQEESLCYCSNLYSLELRFMDEFYQYNRNIKSKCYTDRMIYISDAMFIRDSSLELLQHPVLADIIVSPAVNLGIALKNGESEKKCYAVMKRRMRKILCIFANKGNDNIILGAYGCGVFQNSPKKIAIIWDELLNDEGLRYQFKEIVFAIYNKDKYMYDVFDEIIEK